MKRVFMICGLFILVMVIYISMVGSTYYSPVIDSIYNEDGDTTCPFGFFLGWRPYNYYCWNLDSFIRSDGPPHEMWGYYINPLLEYLDMLNVKDIRMYAGTKTDLIKDLNYNLPPNNNFHPEFKTNSLARFNAMISYIRDFNMNPIVNTYPLGNYAETLIVLKQGNYDTITFGDSLGYKWFWKIMVNLYGCGCDSTDTSIIGSIPWIDTTYKQYIDLDLGIRSISGNECINYWIIANEPECAGNLSWPGYYDDSTVDLSSGIKTFFGYHMSLDHYIDYVKIASEAIHSLSTQNDSFYVIGPSISYPTRDSWPDSVTFYPNGHYTCYWRQVDFWEQMNNSYLLDSFDIISVHGYFFDVNTIFLQLDSLDSILRHYGKNKKIWVTEIGWDRGKAFGDSIEFPSTELIHLDSDSAYTADTAISNLLIKYAENQYKRTYLEKTFLYVTSRFTYPEKLDEYSLMSFLYRPTSITGCPAKASFDIRSDSVAFSNNDGYTGYLYDPIPFNTFQTLDSIWNIMVPYVRLTYPDSEGIIFISGKIYNVSFDSLRDNYSTYTTATPLDSFWIKLEYSTNNGSTWSLITDIVSIDSMDTSTIGQGSYDWSIPYLLSDECKVRAYAYDSFGLIGISRSDHCFSIQKSIWFHQFSPYELSWEFDTTFTGWDLCESFIENSNNEIVGLNWIQPQSAGDVESAGVVVLDSVGGYLNSKLYPPSSISHARSILQHPDSGYVMAGRKFQNNNYNLVIHYLDDSFNIVKTCNELLQNGEIWDLVHANGDTFIAVGTNNNGKIYMAKYHITADSRTRLSRVWDKNWGLSGCLLSVIKSTDGYYVATGYISAPDSLEGICILKADASGNLVDLWRTESESVWFGGIGIIQDGNYYVAVGKEYDSLSNRNAFIWRMNYGDDSDAIPPNNEYFKRYHVNDSLFLESFNSLFIDDSRNYIVRGLGVDTSHGDVDLSVVVKVDNTNGNIIDICAPMSVFYDENTYVSGGHAGIIQTHDGGFVIGGRIRTFTEDDTTQSVAFVKFTDESDAFLQDNTTGNPTSIFQSYSVLLANSLFRDHSTIRFILPRQSHVRINVYNILGQRVRTLADDERQPGAYEIIWDGRDNHGIQVSSGSYFLRFEAGEFKTTKSLTVIR